MLSKENLERFEALVAVDQKTAKVQSELDTTRLELRETKSELKKLKALDPERIKKNLAENKKKLATKNSELKARNSELLKVRKQLRECTAELDLSQNEEDHFFESSCQRWVLSFSGFQFPNEKPDPESVRVRCLDRETGASVVARDLEEERVVWSIDIGIPEKVSQKAAEKILELGISPK